MPDFKSLGEALYRDIQVYYTSAKTFLYYDCNVYVNIRDEKACLMSGSKDILSLVMESQSLSAHAKLSAINPINNLAESLHAYNKAMSCLRGSPDDIALRVLFRYVFSASSVLPKDKVGVHIVLSSEMKGDVEKPIDFSISGFDHLQRIGKKLTKIQKKSETWSYEPLRQWRISSPPHNETLIHAPNPKDALLMDELWHIPNSPHHHKRTITPTKTFLIE